eukprot:851772-Rhodomonas_salina.1
MPSVGAPAVSAFDCTQCAHPRHHCTRAPQPRLPPPPCCSRPMNTRTHPQSHTVWSVDGAQSTQTYSH